MDAIQSERFVKLRELIAEIEISISQHRGSPNYIICRPEYFKFISELLVMRYDRPKSYKQKSIVSRKNIKKFLATVETKG